MSGPVSSHHQAHATHPPVNSPHLHVPQLHAHAHHHHSAPTPIPGQDPMQRSSSNDSSPGTDPSPASQASTNIIPDHYRYPAGAQHHAGSPTFPAVHSPPSSMAGHFSTSSSPSYIQHHQQQQQPMYAYHSELSFTPRRLVSHIVRASIIPHEGSMSSDLCFANANAPPQQPPRTTIAFYCYSSC
jgi:hypothetical protein